MYEETPLLQAIYTYICYAVLNMFGWLRDFLRSTGIEKRQGASDNNSAVSFKFNFQLFYFWDSNREIEKDFVPLYSSYESFYTRNVYIRIRDCFNRPICSVPGAELELLERKTNDYNWSFYFTGKKIKALNMGSYNYLGFAENNGPCSQAAIKSVHEYGVTSCSSRQELGTLKCQQYLEALMAKYVRFAFWIQRRHFFK